MLRIELLCDPQIFVASCAFCTSVRDSRTDERCGELTSGRCQSVTFTT